jgi:hypothetical protein
MNLGLRRGDWLVVLAVAVLLPALYATFWYDGGRGLEARILLNGKPWARLDLFQDQDLKVRGPLGISHIQVRDGAVRFVDSPCPTHQCVHQGWLKEGGEVAVCLPNHISVQVLGSNPRFDTMNF